MTVDIRLTVEDVTTKMLTYASIQLERASSVAGSYSLVSTITLVAATYYYTYADATGTLNSWYRYRFYHATGPVASDYSNPFRPDGLTRLKIRQTALEDYAAGMVVATIAGGDSNTAKFDDYRIATSLFSSTKRGKGSWLHPTSGAYAGQTRHITVSSASAGTFDVSPAWAGALSVGDEVEWHWLAGPEEWNRSINKALKRVYHLERVPIVGDSEVEQSLARLVWLTSRNQVTGLWYFPVTDIEEVPWGSGGRWWSMRQDQGYLTLMTNPILETTDTVYLEALRPMPEVFTDASVLPSDCNIDLVAALAYDEILAQLVRPGVAGSTQEGSAWSKARREHQMRLAALRKKHGPHPRWQAPQLQQKSVVTQPWRAR